VTAWETVEAVLIIASFVVPIGFDLGLERVFVAIGRGGARVARWAMRSRTPALPRAIVHRRTV
jgi:hypothetical protein